MTLDVWVNSAGTRFKCIPIKEGAPFGEHWIEVTRENGTTEGIGQFANSFSSEDEAAAWVEKNLENPRYL